MKISIVISTYNGGKYIFSQLESIKNQNRKPDEVLIFDDGSKDDTIKIITKFIKKYNLEKWKLIINEENKGWKRNFMEGIWIAQGDLIFPCDQDDIWMEDKLQIMEEIMLKHPNINVLTSNYEEFYDSGRRKICPMPENKKLTKQVLEENIFNVKYPGCTYCIRKKFAQMSKFYWEADYPHDALFWRMGIFSDSLYSYNKSLISWRKHEDSTFSIESRASKSLKEKQKWVEYAIRVINTINNFIKNEKVNTEKKDKILNKSLKWLKLRRKFYNTRNVLYWLQLASYLNCYDRFKQYLGDLYLVLIKK